MPIAPFPGRFPVDEQDILPEEQDFIARRAEAEPGSLFGLIQRHRNKPLIDALMGMGGEVLTHPGWDFMPQMAVKYSPKQINNILGRMLELGKEAPLRDAAGNVASAIENRLAHLFMRSWVPRYSSQRPIFEELAQMPSGIAVEKVPSGVSYLFDNPSRFKKGVARISEDYAKELPPYYNIEESLLLGKNPEKASDPVAAIGEAMQYLRHDREGATHYLPKHAIAAGETARAAYKTFIEQAEKLYGSGFVADLFGRMTQ